MLLALRAWRVLFPQLFRELPRLVLANLLWLVGAWPLLTLGAATLVAFAWLRQPAASGRNVGSLARRLWWPGTVWGFAWALFALLWLSNLLYWPRLLPPFGQAVALVLLLLVGWLWLALQPCWLAALADGLPSLAALKHAGRRLLAAPAYALTGALPVLLLALLASVFKTFWALAGVGLLLAYWARLEGAEALHET